jgi:magnesium-transporting ATPase (P-type)
MASNWSLNEIADNITYGSFINRIGQAVCESENLFDFIKKAMSILFYTPLAVLISIVFMFYHFSMIITGKS